MYHTPIRSQRRHRQGRKKLIRELENEREIVRRCQGGDLRAYEKIYRHFEQPLLRVAGRLLGNPEDAEDAVQIAFLKLYRGIDNFRFRAKFSSYVFRLMLNVCFDILQRRKRTPLQAMPSDLVAGDSPPDLHLQLEEAIAALPERMRACFVLFAIDDFKQQEIAEILHISLGSVKAQIFQAKSRLRFLLADSNSEVTP